MANGIRILEVTLSGFKTFPDVTTLPLSQGLTAIVGPNGCGKTNIFDALRFVMGENAPSLLRCKDLDELIFAGNDKRTRRNIAEISLVLEVEDGGSLPFPVSDNRVTITRRMERKAGSRWTINGREVRGRDVTLFLGDAATGARSTMIMAQSTIHRFIESSPQQRRTILEDAAKVSGLYTRRDDAKRKLKAAQTQLEHIANLTAELKSQKRKLRKEHKDAVLYRQMKEQIALLQKRCTLYEHKQWHHKRIETEQALQKAEQNLTQWESEHLITKRILTRLDDITQPLLIKSARLDEKWQNAKSQKESLKIKIEHHLTMMQKIDTRLQELDKDQERNKQDIHNAEQQLVAHQNSSAIQFDDSQKAKLVTQKELCHQEWQKTEELYHKARNEWEEVAQTIKRQKDEIDNVMGDVQESDDKLTQLQQKHDSIKENSEDTSNLSLLKKNLTQLKKASEEALKKEDVIKKQLNEASITHARLSERLSLGQKPALGVDAIMHQIEVRKGYEKALMAGLGDDVRASTKKNMTSPSFHAMKNTLEDAPLPSGTSCLADFVTAPIVLERRLKQIAICKDLAEGNQLWHRLKRGQRLVSKEGHVWRWDGFYAPPLSSKEDAEQKQMEAIQHMEDIKKQLAAAQEARQKIIAQEEQSRHDYDTLYQQILQQQSDIQNRKNLAHQIKEMQKTHEQAQKQLQQLQKELEDEDTLSLLKEEGLHLKKELQEKKKALDEAERALVHHEAQRRAAQQNAERRENEEQAWKDNILRHQERMEDIQKRLSATLSEQENMQQQERAWHDDIAQLEVQISQLEQQRHLFAHQKQRLENIHRDHRYKSEQQQRNINEVRLEKTRQEERLAQIDMNTDDASPHDNIPLIKNDEEFVSCQEESAHLMGQLERMEMEGGINLRAEHDMNIIDERLGAMEKETKDVTGAIYKFNSAIKDLNRKGRKNILDAFNSINKNFRITFGRLFSGGKASMSLVDSDDPLEAGLDILVQLPQRKTKSLSLLSGGERSMTALALMVAVFMTQPSPICLLDEVDDALDDENISKLCVLLTDISRNQDTRFILVTHRPLTMSHMERLYGVTMSEGGVSKIVSVSLHELEPSMLKEASR